MHLNKTLQRNHLQVKNFLKKKKNFFTQKKKGDIYSLGCTFYFAKKRWRNIEIGEEVVVLIEEMMNKELNKRISLENIFQRLENYCKSKTFSECSDILSKSKTEYPYVQLHYNEDLKTLKNLLRKQKK